MKDSKPISFLFRGLLLGSMVLLVPLLEGRTRSVEHRTFNDFLEGEFANISLHHNGQLSLAPEAKVVASFDEPIIWRAIMGIDGTLFLATGPGGNIWTLDPEGERKKIHTADEPLIRALALDADGMLYFATSPRGKVYRLLADGEAEVYYNPEEEYIWDMLFDDEGILYLATGGKARIHQVLPPEEGEEEDPPGTAKGNIFYESEEDHLLTLAWDHQERLLAGSSPNGLVYRFDAQGQPFVLFDTEDTEIKAIIPESNQSLVIAAYSRQGSAAGSGGRSGNVAQTLQAVEQGQQDTAEQSSPRGTRSRGRAPLSTLYRYHDDGYLENIWAVPGIAVHSLGIRQSGEILVGAGDKGMVFGVSALDDWHLWQAMPEGGEVSAMVHHPVPGKGLYVLTSHPATIVQMAYEDTSRGKYTSPVFSAERLARWGRLYTDEVFGEGRVTVSLRGGNTAEPNQTWTDWTVPVAAHAGAPITVPAVRHLQYRLHFAGQSDDDIGPFVRGIRFFYRYFNAAPQIGAIRRVPGSLALELLVQPPQNPQVDLDQLFRGDGSMPTTGMRTQLRAFERPGYVTLAWQARDPDDDPLRYRLRLRKRGEDFWTTLAENLEVSFYSFEAMGFTEGYYQAEVTASDHLAHSAGEARSVTRKSDFFLIDHTPPEIVVEEQRIRDRQAVFRIRATDGVSLISHAEYRLNGGDSRILFPEDGFFDHREETFVIRLDSLPTGRHHLLVRIEDEAGNARNTNLSFQIGHGEN